MPVKNNNRPDRGKNRKGGNAPRLTAEEQRTKLAKEYGIKPKTKMLVDMLNDNIGMTQTEAYRLLHPNANEKTVRSAPSKILKKPAVIGYRDNAVKKAKRRIVTLIDSNNESIALKASESIIDRNEGRAVQKSENTSRVIEVKLDMQGVRIGTHYIKPEPIES